MPDIIGAVGKAWDVTDANHEFTLSSWFMLHPSAHPMWHWYWVNLVHLRGSCKGEDPHLDYPEAEYEILIFALDPSAGDPPIDTSLSDETGIKPAKILTPANLKKQFHRLNDEQAIELTRKLVAAFITGYLNPDTDGNRETVSSIDLTIAHYNGEHDDDHTCDHPDYNLN